jgi:hypothetical protein
MRYGSGSGRSTVPPTIYRRDLRTYVYLPEWGRLLRAVDGK